MPTRPAKPGHTPGRNSRRRGKTNVEKSEDLRRFRLFAAVTGAHLGVLLTMTGEPTLYEQLEHRDPTVDWPRWVELQTRKR